ncbi:MAG: FAD-binding protein, partial [Clostridia bacterium]|nr:FAD-binding protein [Clostridia bacterium]
ASQWLSWPTTTEGYMWTSDNLAEIEKGWIIKADTIEELAAKIGRDPEQLKATIEKWNADCAAGVDSEFGRNPEKMAPIDTAPYYAVSITPTLVGTTGGAKRDTAGRVLDWNDQPIAGLYEAGELGSYFSNLYQNGTFLSEAMLSGRAAAQTAFGGVSEIKVFEKAEAAGPAWAGAADGDYSAMCQGLHDPFEVIFTVKDGKLVEAKVGAGSENMFMTAEQFAQYTGAMIEAQDPNVDIVAGATVDCQAIGAGVNEAFAK